MTTPSWLLSPVRFISTRTPNLRPSDRRHYAALPLQDLTPSSDLASPKSGVASIDSDLTSPFTSAIRTGEGREKPAWILNERAETADRLERSQTLWEAVTYHRWAVIWSLAVTCMVVMDGSDTAVMGSVYAIPAFQKKFGFPYEDGYEVSAAWQATFNQTSNLCSILGCFLGAHLTSQIGYRPTLILGLLWLVPWIGTASYAPNLPVLLVSEGLCSLAWGGFSTLGPGYASEICPVQLRAYMTMTVNLAWAFGHFIGAGVLLGGERLWGVWSYRLPFVAQWAWPLPLAVLVLLAPESPWQFIRRGRLDLAKSSIRRLAPGFTQAGYTQAGFQQEEMNDISVEDTLAFMGTDLRRTEITVVMFLAQIFCGYSFAGYSTYFMREAGLPTTAAFTMTMISYALESIGTIFSGFLVTGYGRRPILMWGLVGMGVGFLLIAIVSLVAERGNTTALWAQAILMITWVAGFNVTLGPLVYVVAGETSSTRLRTKTMALGRAAYYILGIASCIVMPYMINKSAWNWGGRSGFFWAPLNFLCAIYVFFRVPEMKGRTFYELDLLFQNKIPARAFKYTDVNDLPPLEDSHSGRTHGS